MAKPLISVNIAVLNGNKYVHRCLEAVSRQSLDHSQVEINILDNGSTDGTINAIDELSVKLKDFAHVNFIKSGHNFGMWGGQEELFKSTTAPYCVALSVDVILADDFLEKAVSVMEAEPKRGMIQAKVYQYDHAREELSKETIDTCGFKIFHSRRVVNIGHGERDSGQYEQPTEIFGTEGAVPVIRMSAMESIRVMGEIADHDLFWYAEDLDIAWRLRLAGWSHWYEPALIAWHDRQTTKRSRQGKMPRLKEFRQNRKEIPLRKRRLEWKNIRFTIVKNDYIINILEDLPQILVRELAMTLYLLVFEPEVLTEVFTFFKLLPKMIAKRKEILGSAKVSPEAIHSYFS